MLGTESSNVNTIKCPGLRKSNLGAIKSTSGCDCAGFINTFIHKHNNTHIREDLWLLWQVLIPLSASSFSNGLSPEVLLSTCRQQLSWQSLTSHY